MAEVVWSEPALADLEAIADYVAIENRDAAAELVRRAVGHVEQLARHAEGGSRVPELGRSRYRQLVEPPCRIFYRYDGRRVFILHVMRVERMLRRSRLTRAPRSKT